MATKIVFPEWARILYRGARVAIVTAFTQTVALQVDWTKPDVAIRTLVVSFVSGFLISLGMWARDHFGEKALISKVMPI
jgi:hypothetical protein